jgi:phosphoserine aminotransferase
MRANGTRRWDNHSMDPSAIVIPAELRPSDGRFGSGPSKVRPEAVAALASSASGYLGTSHRRPPVTSIVGRLRDGLVELFSLPHDYEVVVGNGGATAFWDAMVFSLVERVSQHYVFGEFSSKCADAARRAPHLGAPQVIESEPGAHPALAGCDGCDVCALTHNETSTGVMMPVERPGPEALVAVDATSGAGGLAVDPAEFDVYYFALQKSFASDGGLWVALCSPSALERVERITRSGRYIPASLDLGLALEYSRKNQTHNTPALATLFLAVEQIDWINDRGGLPWAVARCDHSAELLYSWAEGSSWATPYVTRPEQRSRVVGTVDLDDRVDAGAVARALRANGIVDTEPYRKLGRNQLRIGMYPAIEPGDVAAVTRSIDYVVTVL